MDKLKSGINTYILLFNILIVLLFVNSCTKNNEQALVRDSILTTADHKDLNKDSISQSTLKSVDSTAENRTHRNTDSLNAIIEKKRKKDSLKVIKENEVKIAAYYFHPTARCVTCRNIEAYSIEAIKEWEEQNKKQISWQDINIEDSVNEHYVNEYRLEFSSLVIVKYTGGKKDDWKNLAETWKLVNDKTTFIKYVKFELNKFAKQNEQKGSLQ